jgi:hypothetical protein
MEKEQTNLRLRTDIKDRGNQAVSKGLFVGINDLSGLVELAVDELLKTKGA